MPAQRPAAPSLGRARRGEADGPIATCGDLVEAARRTRTGTCCSRLAAGYANTVAVRRVSTLRRRACVQTPASAQRAALGAGAARQRRGALRGRRPVPGVARRAAGGPVGAAAQTVQAGHGAGPQARRRRATAVRHAPRRCRRASARRLAERRPRRRDAGDSLEPARRTDGRRAGRGTARDVISRRRGIACARRMRCAAAAASYHRFARSMNADRRAWSCGAYSVAMPLADLRSAAAGGLAARARIARRSNSKRAW